MTRRRLLFVVGLTLFAVIAGFVIRNQIKVSKNRQERARQASRRDAMFDLLQPVALKNCQLERFGEPHDGGYLMCANLLGGVQAGYSYGISGYDKWGCDISTRLSVRLHQYDCFNTTRPSCAAGDTVFHAECVAPERKTEEGRLFDTIQNQLAKNGDAARHIALKIDVEGAEWDSFLAAPDELFNQIDQMAVEFHGVEHEKYFRTLQRLRQFFYVAHIHFNNYSCTSGLEPFPTWAYEVLFVNKRLGVVDQDRRATVPNPLDAPNNPGAADCHPANP